MKIISKCKNHIVNSDNGIMTLWENKIIFNCDLQDRTIEMGVYETSKEAKKEFDNIFKSIYRDNHYHHIN